jgi:catechol 2,3-dioxygenase-like lactoylglutathione lyase family enzyme
MYQEDSVSRVQLALNVSDLDAAVDFYSKLFNATPTKLRPGYANFAISDPPLKLVLIESVGHETRLNHLGVEVETSDAVASTGARLARQELATATEEGVACCYALQDKVWVDDPDGAPWEIYTVLDDAEMPAGELRHVEPEAGVSAPSEASTAAACCAERPDLASQTPAST